MAKKDPSRKITTPVAVEQFPKQSRKADPSSDPSKGLVVCSCKGSGNECSNQEERSPAPSQAENRDSQVYWTAWI